MTTRVVAVVTLLALLAACAPAGDAGEAGRPLSAPESSGELPILPIGGDFTLTDQNSQPFALSSLRGKVVLIFFGFAGEGFKLEEQVLLSPGEQTTIGDYTARYDRLRVSEDAQKQAVTAYVTVGVVVNE